MFLVETGESRTRPETRANGVSSYNWPSLRSYYGQTAVYKCLDATHSGAPPNSVTTTSAAVRLLAARLLNPRLLGFGLDALKLTLSSSEVNGWRPLGGRNCNRRISRPAELLIQGHDHRYSKHIEIRGCWGSDFSHFYRGAAIFSDAERAAPWRTLGLQRFSLAGANEALDLVSRAAVVKALIDPSMACGQFFCATESTHRLVAITGKMQGVGEIQPVDRDIADDPMPDAIFDVLPCAHQDDFAHSARRQVLDKFRDFRERLVRED